MALRDVIPLVMGTVLAGLFYVPSLPYFASFRRFGDVGLSVFPNWLSDVTAVPVLGVLWLVLVIVALWKGRQTAYGRFVITCIALCCVVCVVQAALTGQTLYARNFSWLVPLLCVAALLGLF